MPQGSNIMKNLFKLLCPLFVLAAVILSLFSCAEESHRTYRYDEIHEFFNENRVVKVTLKNNNVLELVVIDVDEDGVPKKDEAGKTSVINVSYRVASRTALLEDITELINEEIDEGNLSEVDFEVEQEAPWWQKILDFGE